MATITQRISQFRGINRSLQQNGLDVSYAYDAVNVDMVGGKLTNKIGNYRLVTTTDVPAANPIIYFTNDQDYLILRDKFIRLGPGETPRDGSIQKGKGPYEPTNTRTLLDVYNISGLQIRGVGRSFVRANIDFAEQPDAEDVIDTNCIIASGMLGPAVSGTPSNPYWTYRGFLVDGAAAKTAFYYLANVPGEDQPFVVCRKFGSGQYLQKNLEITEVGSDANGKLTYIKVENWNTGEPNMKELRRAVVDGIYIFSDAIDDPVTDEDINKAYAWLKVTNAEPTEADSGDTITFTVDSTRDASEISVGTYVFIRGECSDFTVTFMQMYYGRLFAAAHRSNRDFPRRLFWSRLPGDGRTIEDWTSDDISVDTSGGHVDIGDPSDGYITGLIVCGTQLLIFTQTRLWRLYGTSPSNYRLELVGNLEGSRVSNPIEVNGAVYWMSLAGICYYNGSYIIASDDNYNTRHIIEDLPEEIQDSMYYSTVHANLFDNSIMFSFDPGLLSVYTYPIKAQQEAVVIRYELETGNVMRYVVPCTNFLQQFTDSLSYNFGVIGGNTVEYETRYFQALVHVNPDTQNPGKYTYTMTMTQWHDWGRQEWGWYDNQAIESTWETDWDDLRQPEVVKKVHTAIMRGSGEFDLSFESETNREKLHVVMPNSRGRVYEATPRYAEGCSMKMCISSNKEFEIEPYMTMIFEAGGKR